jgi:hypothetical protein
MGFLENFLFLESFFNLKREIFYFKKVFSGYRRAVDTLNESPKNFKKSRNKRFVHN